MLFEKKTYEDDFPIHILIAHIIDYPFHYHHDHELVYVLQGEVLLKNGSGSYLLKDGDVFTNSGREVHGLKATDRSNIVAIIQIGNHFFSQYFPVLNKACFRTYVNDDKYRQLDTLRKMLLNILINYTKRSFNYKSTCTEQMIDVIKYLNRYFNLFAFEDQVVVNFKNDNPVIIERISSIINYIYENHSDKITLETLAEREHLSTFYLSHLVRDYMGISFQELLCFARAEMSEIPLLETDRKISAIARDSGFSATSYYNKYFVKWFGHTPQVHRQLHAAHILGPDAPARFEPLSENDAVSLLRTRLSALKDQENSDSKVRQLMYRVELSADMTPIRKNHPVPEVLITHEDYFVLGERLFPLLYDLHTAKVALAVSADDDKATTALIRNRLRFLGYEVSILYENSLQNASSYGYDSIAYAVSILRSCFLTGQKQLSCRLRDQGSSSVILKGAPSCITSGLIPKPAFYAYRLLQDLGGDLLYWDPHCYVIKTDTQPETWVLALIHYNQDILNLCSRNAGIHETKDVISAFRDELQVDFRLTLPAGRYTIIQTAFSNANSVFSHMAHLGFPDRFPLISSGTRLFSTEPQSQMRTEDVTETMDISSSISGAGVHITMIQNSDEGSSDHMPLSNSFL